MSKQRADHVEMLEHFQSLGTDVKLHEGEPVLDFEIVMMSDEELNAPDAGVDDQQLLRAALTITHFAMVGEAATALARAAAGMPDGSPVVSAVGAAQSLGQRCRLAHHGECVCRGCSRDLLTSLVALGCAVWSRMRLRIQLTTR